MSQFARLVSTLIASTIGIAVMVILATVVFYITIFVVSTSARLAGYSPSADFVILAASLVVVAVILTGGLTPRLSDSSIREIQSPSHDDPTYD